MIAEGSRPLNREPQLSGWHQDAVFYEVPVKAYYDANGDGIGDFQGLIRKLDYIQELGATCIWLLPFYASPWRDDGYDVADYRSVHPAYGTIDDFREFLSAAHQRGMRVAAEMVINHTSDQHPWFQAARAAPAGSPLREFYVWRDTPDGFCSAGGPKREGGANWTWDSRARAYYWHRFFDHQPDLNFENPLVREEMLKVLRFWADLGIDGLCLNGAAYLVERDGTRCEHLPQTHAVLREIRQELQGSYPDLMIQAGMDAWPADAATYFGQGDECHMAPHLALAQRIFLAVRQEDRRPIVDILHQTPEVPADCQWVTLLRNHDELTLALATDEERDYLFREYAADSSMRLHNGILRRLAPLAENSRRRIELLFGLLFSLPGSPMVYYGDEIGMGDNVFLAGRLGVRTPMQWTADRNAGFSVADFARLYCPPVMDQLYGYPVVNVEGQLRDTSSLLHWMRRLIGVRKRHRVFSRGRVEILEPNNRKVVALVRSLPPQDSIVREQSNGSEADTILVVANLSRHAQAVELDLSRYGGLVPVEMFGRAPFPRIGDSRYLITLCPHAFYWFQLQRTATDVPSRLVPVVTQEVEHVPIVETAGAWDDVFSSPAREMLEQQVLPAFLRSQRWFGGKAREVQSVRIADWGPMEGTSGKAFFVFLEVVFAGGGQDLYFVPMGVAEGPTANHLYDTLRPWVIARLHGTDQEGVLYDVLADDAICTSLLDAMEEGRQSTTHSGVVQASATTAYAELAGNIDYPLPVVRGPATSSNSLVFYGRRLLFKLFRRLEAGTNPDYEVGRFLTEQQHFERIPQVAGTLDYQLVDGRGPYTLGILQGLVRNQGDGWRHAIEELDRYYDRASGRMYAPDRVHPESRPLTELIDADPPATVLETIASYRHAAATLGRRTAEMHLALAGDASHPDFAPEPLTAADMEHVQEEIEFQRQQAFTALRHNLDRLSPENAADARWLLETGTSVLERLAADWSQMPIATKTRIHGDYHLGQVLWVDNDYVILDFEGEPTRTVEARRAKFSPIRDVAGMLRSYHYAAYAGLFAFTEGRPDVFAKLAPWAELWQQWVSAAFLRHYLEAAGGASFITRERQQFKTLLDRFMLAKALYELVYELNNRPDWVRIPLGGVLALLNSSPEPMTANQAR